MANDKLRGTFTDVVFTIKDPENQPVADANVEVKFEQISGKPVIRTGMSDASGKFVAKAFCGGEISWSVSKDGMYPEGMHMFFNVIKSGRKSGEAVSFLKKYTETIDVEMLAKKSPIPMHVYNLGSSLNFPTNNIYLAYDFKKCDFLPPYGKGEVKDCLLGLFGDRARVEDWHYYPKLEMKFDTPGSGAYCVPKRKMRERSNGLRSPYRADTNAVYQSSIVFQQKDYHDESGILKDMCIVFRTRTEVDVNGKIVKANYGKIYGPQSLSCVGVQEFATYFNPTVNDTNLEYSGENLNDWGYVGSGELIMP